MQDKTWLPRDPRAALIHAEPRTVNKIFRKLRTHPNIFVYFCGLSVFFKGFAIIAMVQKSCELVATNPSYWHRPNEIDYEGVMETLRDCQGNPGGSGLMASLVWSGCDFICLSIYLIICCLYVCCFVLFCLALLFFALLCFSLLFFAFCFAFCFVNTTESSYVIMKIYNLNIVSTMLSNYPSI